MTTVLYFWYFSAAWIIFLHFASANTEIVNFVATPVEDAYILEPIDKWLHLGPENNEAQIKIMPILSQSRGNFSLNLEDVKDAALCKTNDTNEAERLATLIPEELLVSLDLDHPKWIGYSKFTLRISWPASYPTDFKVFIDSPPSYVTLAFPESASPSRIVPSTRIKFAKIILTHTGIRTPSSSPESTDSTRPPLEPVPFIIILEPLYLGVIPASTTPTLSFLILVIVVSSISAEPIYKYIDSLAGNVVQDIHQSKSRDE